MLKIFNWLAAGLALILAVGLYRAKSEAEASRDRIATLEREVEAARAAVDSLGAEYAYLSSPARIERLARRELGLVGADPRQHVAAPAKSVSQE